MEERALNKSTNIKTTQTIGRKIMDVTKINEAVKVAQNAGWAMSGDIAEKLESLNNPLYRVFLAGEFQVGKSLLADQVFLGGKGLLRSGIGLPTTSVVTEVVYGETLSISVYSRGNNTPLFIPEPTSDDVSKYTTAESETERTALAEKIEKVVISIPDASLKKYTIMDSPGIDDANESVMINSTLPQILTADAVILVIPPRSLDNVEKKFLQGYLFEKSISRLQIMISYDPKQPKSKQVREELVENIKAELQMMGKEYIPVTICCYDDSVDEDLNTPEKIREAINSFAIKNVEQGRIQRIAGNLLSSFGAYENELRAILKLNGASLEKIDELKTQLEKAEQILSLRLTSAKSKVSSKEVEISVEMRERLSRALIALKEQLMVRFERCRSLGDVQSELLSVKSDMEYNLKQIFNLEASTAKKQIEEVLALIDRELANAANELVTTLDFGYDINTGHLGKLNSKFVTAMDYVLLSLISPLGLLLDVLIRYILGKIPLIKNLLPATFVRNRVVKTIDESLDEISNKVICDITAQFKQCFKRLENDINSHFKLLYQTTIMPIIKAIKEAENNKLSDEDVAKLQKKLEIIYRVSENLRQSCQ